MRGGEGGSEVVDMGCRSTVAYTSIVGYDERIMGQAAGRIGEEGIESSVITS